MTTTPPFRRPKLHLSLTPLLGSPQKIPYITPLITPGNTTGTYSPFRSAGLKPPAPYGGPMRFAPKPSDPVRHRSYICFRIRRALLSRALWLSLVFVALVWWWVDGGKDLEKVKLRASGIGREIIGGPLGHNMRDMQFFPASNPKIHYIGRWTATPNQLRRDGAFPGVYFDIVVRNTTGLHLSLHNEPEKVSEEDGSHPSSIIPDSRTAVNAGHFNFVHPHAKPARPISLLARVDDEEYILLPNCSGMVSVRSTDLGRHLEHRIRIVAPMTDDNGKGIFELEGIWLSKGGRLGRVEGTLLGQEYENEDALHAENEQIGEKHRSGLDAIIKAKAKGNDTPMNDDEEDPPANQTRKMILEVVTDTPGSYISKSRGRRTGGAEGLLGGVMGWEYLLGEMFGIDHVSIGIDGVCLMQDCIGGTGNPPGMGDVFFRSGPSGSEYFEHQWTFNSYVPDVLVVNLGDSDYASIEAHETEYVHTTWELLQRFEVTYTSFIRAIRTLAYPHHPANVYSKNSPDTAPASIPIFVMRPFRGQLEHATQTVVSKLRADGDKSVFWLDTSGWLDTSPDSLDFFLDESTLPGKWRLTVQGNQRVAIFLHMHVCRYLAADDEKCAFLPPEVYKGKAFVPEEANFDRFVENEKERKLKKLFWDEERVEKEGLDLLG